MSHNSYSKAFKQASTKDMESLFGLSSSLICIAGYDGYFKQLGSKWESILGYSNDELLSKPFIEFVHPDDKKATITEVNRLVSECSETISFVNRYMCSCGSTRWLQWNVTPEKENEIFYCIASDITELKKTQTELELTNNGLLARVKALNCLYNISKKLSSKETNFQEICQFIIEKILLVYKGSAEVCGRIYIASNHYQTENLKETEWKKSVDIFSKNNKIGEIEVYNLEEQTENVSDPFIIDDSNLLNTISEMIGDYICRVDADFALAQSEEKHRILSEHTKEGFFVFQNDRFIYANDLFSQMIEHQTPDALHGTEISRIIPADSQAGFKKICSEIVSGKVKRKSFRGQLLTRNGRSFWVDGSFSYIHWFGKGSIVATLRDIDDDVQHEQIIKNETAALRRENLKLKSTLKDRFRYGTIIGKSKVMQDVYEQITEAASTDASVVILGETGTGKEEVARTIHKNSKRGQNGFVPINCGAIPATLFESELFGYKKGAFSGAFLDKHGFLDLAHEGTFFLDEVGEIDLNMQVKLLRVLETGEYIPVGANKAKCSDVRIISATNADLKTQVKEKKMREDFYYRINVIPINLPPLRERKEDIPLLIEHFLKKHDGGKLDLSLSGQEIDILYEHSWPGNIRELQNVVQRYISARNLNFFLNRPQNRGQDHSPPLVFQETSDFRTTMRNYEIKIITEALEKNHWHKEKTAAMLGLPKRTFFRKLNSIGLKKA